MASINVSPEELENLSAMYAHAAQTLEQELQQLQARSASVRQEWVGSSSSAFQHLNAQLEGSRRQLLDALQGMSKALAAASAAYRSTDASISSAFEL